MKLGIQFVENVCNVAFYAFFCLMYLILPNFHSHVFYINFGHCCLRFFTTFNYLSGEKWPLMTV